MPLPAPALITGVVGAADMGTVTAAKTAVTMQGAKTLIGYDGGGCSVYGRCGLLTWKRRRAE